MLKIQVLGHGLIPRIQSIAPRKEPFMADYNWIALILSTPGLEVNYVDPTDNSIKPLERTKFREIYDRFENVEYKDDAVEEAAAPQQAPVAPKPKFEEVKPVEEKKIEEPNEEAKKDQLHNLLDATTSHKEDFFMKPIMEEKKDIPTEEKKEDSFKIDRVENESNDYQRNNGKKNKHNH